MKKVAIILTVFNRKDVTLQGLRHLYLAIKNVTNLSFDVFMLDDKSTDGTANAVAQEFPNTHIITSEGNLYWGGGMRRAWETALSTENYDYFIWFNDDVILKSNAIESLFEIINECGNKCIVCGAFCSNKGVFSYGGLTQKRERVIPNGGLQKIHYMNGNLVLIPSNIVQTLGILDPKFKHIKGDFDYGLTAIENGIPIYTTKQYIGFAERNPQGDSRGRKNGCSLIQRFKILYKSPFMENPNIAFYFNRKHKFSLFYCSLIYIKSLIINILPDKIYSTITKFNA